MSPTLWQQFGEDPHIGPYTFGYIVYSCKGFKQSNVTQSTLNRKVRAPPISVQKVKKKTVEIKDLKKNFLSCCIDTGNRVMFGFN